MKAGEKNYGQYTCRMNVRLPLLLALFVCDELLQALLVFGRHDVGEDPGTRVSFFGRLLLGEDPPPAVRATLTVVAAGDGPRACEDMVVQMCTAPVSQLS